MRDTFEEQARAPGPDAPAPGGGAEAPVVLSVVVPVYNEAAGLGALFARLRPVLEGLGLRYEVICVNDGSSDATLAVLLEQRRHWPALKVVELTRNFGKEAALSAGLAQARGAAVVPMDADLQDPPELLPALVARWRAGYEVVYATRRSRRGEGWLKRVTAEGFYWVLARLADCPIPRDTGDFRLLDRRVVEVLCRLPERTRFLKGLFAWVGFRQTAVAYDRPARQAGASRWSWWRLWNFALDGLTSFSSLPLRVWSYVGLGVSAAAFLYAGWLIGRTLLYGIDVPGYASLMVVVLFLGGVQLLSLGVLGEYLGRVFVEVKGRPLYLIRARYGFDPEPDPAAERPVTAAEPSPAAAAEPSPATVEPVVVAQQPGPPAAGRSPSATAPADPAQTADGSGR